MEMKMGRCWMEGAYEMAEIMFSDSTVIDRWLDEGEQWPHTLMSTLAGWYLYSPQPSAEDIAGQPKVERQGGWWVVTIRIRRGKEMLAAFFSQHRQVMTKVDDVGVSLVCKSCPTIVRLPWDSFGHLGGSLVREAIASTDAEKAEGSGCVLRTGYDSDSGVVSQRGEGSVGASGSR